jgi:hypothetical protein
MRFQRLCSHRYCARGVDDGNAKRSSKQRERSHEQEYLSVNWQPGQEGDLYRRAGVRGMNLDVTVNAP